MKRLGDQSMLAFGICAILPLELPLGSSRSTRLRLVPRADGISYDNVRLREVIGRSYPHSSPEPFTGSPAMHCTNRRCSSLPRHNFSKEDTGTRSGVN